MASDAAWKALEAHGRRLAAIPVRQLFAQDAERFAHFSREADGLLLDFKLQASDHMRVYVAG